MTTFKGTQTGPVGSIQKEAVDANAATKAEQVADANAMSRELGNAKKGSIVYTAKTGVFNCIGPNRQPINFRAGAYIVPAEDKETIAVLDGFVSRGYIKREVID